MTFFRLTLSSIFLIFFLFSIVLSQGTGKIAGQVTDKESGEPLIGVNVTVVGTHLGAATDADGWYIILNVPPGNNQLLFTYIGYQNVTVENVMVRLDRTTNINITMAAAALEFGETVTVTAERPIVEADKTSSSLNFEAKEVANLPVENLRNVLELTPGVSKNADGTMSIRGGGAYEINYSINGIKSVTTNSGVPAYGTGTKSENSWKYDVNPLAVSQMEVITGGFNAEYGNAQSGVVNVVMKEGDTRFFGGLSVEYRPSGQYHWGDYLYSKNQFEWRKWGDFNVWLQQPQFQDTTGGVATIDTAEAWRNYNLWVQNHTPSDDNPLGVYDYRQNPYHRYLFSLGGPLGKLSQDMTFFISGELLFKPTRLPTNEQVQKKQNYSLVLAWKPNANHNLKVTGLYQKFYSGMGSGSDDVRWAGLWGQYGAKRKYTLVYDSPRDETVFATSLNYKLIFSPTSFLETTFTWQNEVLYAYQTPTPGWDKDVQLHPDPEDRVLEDRGPWNEKYREYYTWSSLYNQASITNFYEGKINYSVQLTKTNLLKAGLEASLMDQNYNASSSLSVSAFIWRTGFATNYKADTWYTAGYLQDKLEFAGMVANLGVRFDAYNFGADVPVDKYNVFYPALGSNSVGIPEWEPSKTFTVLSPRLGLSFPIGETTAFRVQYGHFRSMPTINQALDNQTFNGWGSYGNPNLKPKLSINYEVGVQKNLWGTHQLDVVTYYNDLVDQISLVYIASSTGSVNKPDDLKQSYISYENNGYGNTRGIEISFSNRTPGNWRYRFAYTLSQASYGQYGVYLIRPDLPPELEQKYTYSASDYLAPEDRTHRLNASLTYNFPDDAGFRLLNIQPLENTSVSLIVAIRSGLAYFWSPEYQYEYNVESNRRYPSESQTDLRIEKTQPLGDVQLKLGIRVYNLFDNRHLTPISEQEELDRYVLRSVTYADPGNDPNRDLRLYNYYQTWRNIPRQVFFTVGFLF
ncbi:MAG: TonB-dependent receptor [Calditrichaeota bacterium]|nr:TonB-dependent receptor [Calditrichota bacterium]RQW07280.1 MAG: TonB-dependent receptor [Calditrichota bacterium]